MPYLSLPTVGLMEATPLKWAGILKLPPISVPVPNMHPCAPTKLPVPELLPPGLNLGFVAFTVHPNTGLSLPYLIKVKITKTMKTRLLSHVSSHYKSFSVNISFHIVVHL